MASVPAARFNHFLSGLVPLPTSVFKAPGLRASYLACMSTWANEAAASTIALYSDDRPSKAFVLMKKSSFGPPSHQPG